MSKGLLLGVLLSVFLCGFTPAEATIRVNVENPANGQDLSGIVTISGWAFSTLANTNVTVTLTVDGDPNKTAPIPCCGPRGDVQAANPGAPANSSFGLLFNYGILSAGPHTLRIDVTAPGEPAQSVQVTVTVAKPGDAQVLSNFTIPSGATVAADANEIVLVGAQVTPQGGSPTTVNLRAAYATNLQSLVIIQAFAGTNAQLFNAAQAIFTTRCGIPSCHAGSTPAEQQDLTAANSFKNIVGVRSVENAALLRVNPGDDDGSYLYQKIIANGNIAAGTTRMPQGCAGSNCLSDSEITAIEDWIKAGAPAPQ